MAVTEALRQSIILGATSMTGAMQIDEKGNPMVTQWETQLKANAKRLTGMFSDMSPIAKTISMMDEAKKFPATILYVGKEPKTNRGFVVFKTKPNDKNPDGIESARTEIVDWADKTSERFVFAKTAQSLVGHRVFVYIELQEVAATGRKSRVLQHFDDLGADNFVTQEEIAAGKAFAAEKMSR